MVQRKQTQKIIFTEQLSLGGERFIDRKPWYTKALSYKKGEETGRPLDSLWQKEKCVRTVTALCTTEYWMQEKGVVTYFGDESHFVPRFILAKIGIGRPCEDLGETKAVSKGSRQQTTDSMCCTHKGYQWHNLRQRCCSCVYDMGFQLQFNWKQFKFSIFFTLDGRLFHIDGGFTRWHHCMVD